MTKSFTSLYQRAHRLLWLATFVCLGSVLLLGALALYQRAYHGAFFPRTRLAGRPLSGLTYTAARQMFAERVDAFGRQGVPVTYGDTTLLITAAVIADSPDAAFDLFHFDIERSLNELYRRGRAGNLFTNVMQQLADAFTAPDYGMYYTLDEKRLTELLQQKFSGFAEPARNATIVSSGEALMVTPETQGKIFDYEHIVTALRKHLTRLDATPIPITLVTDYPTARAADIEPLLPQAEQVLAQAPLTLRLPPESIPNPVMEVTLAADELAALLTGVPDADGSFRLGLKTAETAAYFANAVAPLTDVAPVDAKFEIQNGRVTEFVASKDGQRLAEERSRGRIEELLRQLATNATATTSVTLVLAPQLSDIKNDDVNDLGITEIIGTGHSNFAGSPPNRRHNIRVGAAAVNGTLIKPNEEFSLLKTLGDISAATGYLPELVIKGNETVPEYGGGLCQIGTTVFRGTTESGLPVTARRNHSYRVSYYEPAGTDATIYDPTPDFKFVNDTGSYVLIQSRIENNDLYFDFWGTHDGRTVKKTEPVIYNITAPPPTKIIETDTLPPGKKKCTESAHNGADAYFDYTVTYADGATKEERFQSHYRPWQEVCLVGVEAQTATTTPPARSEDNISL